MGTTANSFTILGNTSHALTQNRNPMPCPQVHSRPDRVNERRTLYRFMCKMRAWLYIPWRAGQRTTPSVSSLSKRSIQY